MFNKKLKEDIDNLYVLCKRRDERILELERDIKRLKCPHDGRMTFSKYGHSFVKVCDSCGAVVDSYWRRNDFHFAQADYYQKHADNLLEMIK